LNEGTNSRYEQRVMKSEKRIGLMLRCGSKAGWELMIKCTQDWKEGRRFQSRHSTAEWDMKRLPEPRKGALEWSHKSIKTGKTQLEQNPRGALVWWYVTK